MERCPNSSRCAAIGAESLAPKIPASRPDRPSGTTKTDHLPQSLSRRNQKKSAPEPRLCPISSKLLQVPARRPMQSDQVAIDPVLAARGLVSVRFRSSQAGILTGDLYNRSA